MPTPMPGNPNNEIYVYPNTLSDLADNFKNIRSSFDSATESELGRLGRILVKEVKKNTPRGALGRLRRSTQFRIIKFRKEDTNEVNYELQIIQDAVAQHTTSSKQRYFYWYTVHHGLAPRGRLTRIFPPAENLVKWVMRVKGVGDEAQALREAYAISRSIFEKGIAPNPYLKTSVRNQSDAIQQTADRITKALVVDLTRLPEIVLPPNV